jgi:NADPH:quinone reductase-like Zn-dependent oxidoreductase
LHLAFVCKLSREFAMLDELWEDIYTKQEISMNLKNQKIVIIGGSSGIGFAIAKTALDEGAKIVIIIRNADKLKLAKTQLYIGKLDS